MPLLNLQTGHKIEHTNENTIEIRVPLTPFWVSAEQKKNKKWDAYLRDPQTGHKEILKKDATTRSFALFSNIILKSPFPYEGKKAQELKVVKKFIKKITKQKNGK